MPQFAPKRAYDAVRDDPQALAGWVKANAGKIRSSRWRRPEEVDRLLAELDRAGEAGAAQDAASAAASPNGRDTAVSAPGLVLTPQERARWPWSPAARAMRRRRPRWRTSSSAAAASGRWPMPVPRPVRARSSGPARCPSRSWPASWLPPARCRAADKALPRHGRSLRGLRRRPHRPGMGGQQQPGRMAGDNPGNGQPLPRPRQGPGLRPCGDGRPLRLACVRDRLILFHRPGVRGMRKCGMTISSATPPSVRRFPETAR